MKKKIVILGSTGSIGKSLLNIIAKDKHNFRIELLSAKKNYKLLIQQAKKFKVKNIIITDSKYYRIALSKKIKKINIYNDFNDLKKIIPKKIDYVMSSIVGLDGLDPTIKLIKFTKKIAIANKESIICGWSIIRRELKKNQTEFMPVDSEHFSIWYALKNIPLNKIKNIYITASGGSLLNISKNKFDKLDLNKILKHPNWKMGKKITIDSSTMMNKVFEIIEAKKIFNLKYNQLKIIIHPKSYVHAIVELFDGMIKIIAHDTTMDIPIFNSIYNHSNKKFYSKDIDFNKLNNLSFEKPNQNKFLSLKILKNLPEKNSLFETVLVAANDELVNLFLNKKIKFSKINQTLDKIIQKKEYQNLKKILPRKISDVINVSNTVRYKIRNNYI
ncbi:1-deoxy-D-xylulose-5-phosphate reductoisomerase [Candidatus Pelagibacter sp. HIMB1623]|uniref:1-deoxy-D-xylulose-5-phosphate reductoisomerase n=1 Tax=Candidatus Pelagibacter sp. HIMB1623 TaxID=3413358 RepID=UPI003F8372E2